MSNFNNQHKDNNHSGGSHSEHNEHNSEDGYCDVHHKHDDCNNHDHMKKDHQEYCNIHNKYDDCNKDKKHHE